MNNLDILYEDNHLLVVNKPAGIATMGAESGPTVHSMAAEYLKKTYNKPGRAYVGIVSRLDAMTSGVLVLARTSKAASRLTAQFARTTSVAPIKLYLAGVEGQLGASHAEWVDHVRKDDRAKRMRTVKGSADSAQQATLRFVVIGEQHNASLVAVQLGTGRKHQIRVQFADRGHPVVGDRKYGSRRHFSAGVALHSWRLQIMHPVQRRAMWFEAPVPKSWQPFRRILPDANSIQRTIEPFLSTHDDDHR